jgi:hypothetical protein
MPLQVARSSSDQRSVIQAVRANTAFAELPGPFAASGMAAPDGRETHKNRAQLLANPVVNGEAARQCDNLFTQGVFTHHSTISPDPEQCHF